MVPFPNTRFRSVQETCLCGRRNTPPHALTHTHTQGTKACHSTKYPDSNRIVPGCPARVPAPESKAKATQKTALSALENHSQPGFPFHSKVAKAGSDIRRDLRRHCGKGKQSLFPPTCMFNWALALLRCSRLAREPVQGCVHRFEDPVWLGKDGIWEGPTQCQAALNRT
uniref:Uncharacterized protein n=1 Tax=Sphaerodactylus townsendi TaxID=933632 RepID=A0ACB8ECT7_9SAUR